MRVEGAGLRLRLLGHLLTLFIIVIGRGERRLATSRDILILTVAKVRVRVRARAKV